MPVRALTGGDALTLAKQTASGAVHLVAVEYNWGPPISGRFDTDFFNIWAAVWAGVGAGSLFLQGKNTNGEWSINIPLEWTASFMNSDHVKYEFFSLALEYQSAFPTAFVLRFESNNGDTSYDNNRGCNYSIEPWRGWGVSAIRKDEAIFDLGQVVGCRLFWAAYPPSFVTTQKEDPTNRVADGS
jgi:hypothetical protein